ncbi:MAG: DUF4132 domain-containing protein, partial [Cyanobacteria bacterium P01_F01_bin.153]
ISQEIEALSREEQRDFLLFLLLWCNKRIQAWRQSEDKSRNGGYWHGAYETYEVCLRLFNRKFPFGHDHLILLMETLCDVDRWYFGGGGQLVKALQNHLKDNPLTSELEQAINAVCDGIQGKYSVDAQGRKHIAQLQKLLPKGQLKLPLVPGEYWSDRAIATLHQLSEEDCNRWAELLDHCAIATAAKPSKKWSKKAATDLEKLNPIDAVNFLADWFLLLDKPRTRPVERRSQWEPDPSLMINDRNADILKGLVWLCPSLVSTKLSETEAAAGAQLVRSLGTLAQSAYRKVPGVGPRCVRVGNACVWALGEISGAAGEAAIGQLALMKVKVKFGTAQKGIEKALTAAAERAGLPREEIEEMAVPTYGLAAVGVRRETLGNFTAELEVTGTSSTVLQWIKPGGKPQKSVPKAVKDDFAEELKELKQAAKDIKKMMPAQRDRLESVYLQRKSWDFPTWQERYLNHPLMGNLARRLIWWFTNSNGEETAGIWLGESLVDINDQPLEILDKQAQVRLWHPLDASSATILTWRNWLVTHEIQQPFKQAHREIYLLTAAEENTETYSNRFAAHILKQHQFNALCGHRGWKNTLRLMVDDCFPPASLSLPQWNLRAEFWVDGIGEDYGSDTNETGTYWYLATDQVRFYPIDAAQNFAYTGSGDYGGDRNNPNTPLPLAQIPPLVLSEVMRDVDLFVGVASVGNDPNWSDGGPEGRYRDYWTSYSFGELSGTAKTRHQLLETLIPKLKIRDRCSFSDRFLVVRGQIRTYKIHLGSGNILMEPNDQYLCIVPDRKPTGGGIFLPFEGDNMLSIILSKAFLLAEDEKITDPTITHQIKRS